MSTSVSVGHRPQPAPGRRPSIGRLAGLLGLTVAIGLGCVETVSAQQDPFIISAFFGLDEELPMAANAAFLPQFNPLNAASGDPNRANPTQANITGEDGLPIVFSEDLNPASVDPSDFLITTASGETFAPLAASVNPSNEPGELHTVLIAGEFGTAPSGIDPGDPPVSLSLVGPLMTVDGVSISPQSVDVIPLADGPTLVFAETVDIAPTADDFVPGSELVLRAIWAGGIVATDGNEVTQDEWSEYVLSGFDDQGNTVELSPFAIGDLNDNDNNHLLYFDQSIIPQTLFLPEGLVIDPNGDANPNTTFTFTSVPEPTSGALIGLGALFTALRRRKRSWQVE